MNPLLTIGVLVILLTAFIALLTLESIAHSKRLKKIPVRISVTGTRGKTSVTRIAASILRESGMKVMAKTTGTEPVIIFPDGSEQTIHRIGSANILEQKKLVRKAVKMGVDCLLTEIMSIHPENHKVESRRLIKPDYTIITNFHMDHIDATGEPDMISLYINDIMEGSNVILPAGEHSSHLKNELKGMNITIQEVDGGNFPEMNNNLAGSLARELGCNEAVVQKGIENSKMDVGELKAWRFGDKDKEIIFINSFAANDPVSASEIIRVINDRLEFNDYKRIGLLNLRDDRGDRSLQWLHYLEKENPDVFEELYFYGLHSRAFIRKLGKGNMLKSKDYQDITNIIINDCQESSIVFGLMNIGGIGLELVDNWKREGKELNI